MMTMHSRSSWLLAVAIGLCACAGGSKDGVDLAKPVTGEASKSAELAYKRGLEEKRVQNYLEATRFFEYVRNNFPYSQFAALSELTIADMSFERDDFAGAANAYKDFVKAHPSHPKADYAAWRVGLANFQDKPSDWFLLPPSYEKDQSPLKNALDALNRFVVTYPKSDYLNKAKDLVTECRRRLAAHEQYVADFYWKRESWKGAAGRELVLADTYGDLDSGKLHGEALWRAGVAYENVKDVPAARRTLTRLLQEAPGNPHRRDAEKMLKALPADPPKAAAAPPIEGEVKAAPLTPAETPGAPQQRPQADPAPGVPPGAGIGPAQPEADPKPARPTTQEPGPASPPAQPPSQQPPTPPLAAPDR